MSSTLSESPDSYEANDVSLGDIDELIREGFSLVETVYRELNLPSPVSRRLSHNNGEIEIINPLETPNVPINYEIIEIAPTTSEAGTIIPASSERLKRTTDTFDYGRNTSADEFNKIVADDGSYACPVCYEKVSSRIPISAKCGHVFCESCINLALRHTHKCPMCNSKLNRRSLRRIFL